MPARRRSSLALRIGVLASLVLAGPVAADHGGPHVVLEDGITGCTGVLPSNQGNTTMVLVGGTLWPGGTAVFEITYPLNASSVGKEFTILDCAFINGEPELKYTVSFVPSNQAFVLRMTLGVPDDAPVGGTYCNYAKTTGSPTAAQASQRKAGPSCFIVRPRPTTTPPAGTPSSPSTPGTPGSSPGSPPGDPVETGSGTSAPILLPDTAMASSDPRSLRGRR
jgi:hypothetical protein